MSHSRSEEERGWDFNLDDRDHVALVACRRVGAAPVDWEADTLVQYISVEPLRVAFRSGLVIAEKPKGAQEGFELRVTWPAAVASSDGVVELIGTNTIRYRKGDGRAVALRLKRKDLSLSPTVRVGDQVRASQILASVVPVTTIYACPGGATVQTYVDLARSTSHADRYAAAKALARFDTQAATDALVDRVRDDNEHVFVRVDAAAGLLRRGHPGGAAFFGAVLGEVPADQHLERRLEAVIVLSEVGGAEAIRLLMQILRDGTQDPEIRAGAAWSLGEVGAREALPALVESFRALETVIKVEAARALAKVTRQHRGQVVDVFAASSVEERPGLAWALSKAGGLSIAQILPTLVDDDAREWVSYIVGTQPKEAMLAGIEELAKQDPQVYFAVTVLWKILSSWVYGLEEY